MIIQSSIKPYCVDLFDDFTFLDSLVELPNKLIVIDRNVYHLYEKMLFANIPKEDIYILDAVEENKTIETALSICERITDIPAKKNANLISIGGGIVQDITGFTANILYRGIQWHFVPTTLLAQGDSCIGGKTSLNYHRHKNLLGTFYPPNAVYICPLFVKTLGNDDYLSGLGEIVKFNVMAAHSGIAMLESDIHPLLTRDYALLRVYIERALMFKKSFIEQDEFDVGVRRLLNFAHTFGHALETISDYAIPHGQAVSLGMLIANRVSFARGQLDTDMCERIERLLLLVISVPLKQEHFNASQIVACMKQDKKRQGAGLAAVLLDRDLHLNVVFDLTQPEVESAVASVGSLLFDHGKMR